MKILLDECVPVQVSQALPDHEVHSATNPPWRGLSNGELLSLAEQQGFELLVIADKNMRHQQDISSRRIAVLELWTNHRPTLERNFEYLRAAAERMAAGQYCELAAPAFPEHP